ncbi:hypothetical protein J2X65_003140 [Ancylobacter sp. 3268]|uniref:host specificity factor TipJ family phage tail protein n=1 Tax=Ancylobacter sp. 3268 TaxID=2817752 RepID=UPI002854FFDB|nr:host specificity factor TipJ family phage tail protein [Ancylobacter sp. 3268]MDR6953777.1 hypothetical protein [Ancylobacter sp. 3268]
MTATSIDVLAMPVIDPGKGRIRMTVPHGARISDIVSEILPLSSEEERRAVIRVSIGGQPIYPHCWHARPRPGQLVVVRIVPGNALKSILSIVVTIAAAVFAPYLAPVLASTFGIGTAAATTLATAGLILGGTLLLNALIPQPKTDSGEGNSPTYDVKGWRNVANPDGPIPAVLGSHRQAPVHSASSYTEIVGDDQYIVARMCFGYGPVLIENLRIGETAIENFEVQTEIRSGWPGDAAITLYPSQVLEEQLSITLDRDEHTDTPEPHIRRTQSDVTAVSIDLTAPGGLCIFDNNGKRKWYDQYFEIEQRLYGTTDWIWVQGLSLGGNQQRAVRRTIYWTVPTRGRYEVRVLRVTKVIDDGKRVDQVQWTALRGYRPEPPLNYTRAPLAEIAIRVKATDELNGVLDQLTADVTRICPDWDSASGTWITRPTRNPASLARWVLQGPMSAKPKTDDELILSEFEDWHEFCAAKGLSYDRVHDYEASLPEVRKMVAAAGRASLRDDGRRIGVIIDRPRSQIVAAITPRNARNFRWSRTYFRPPHAYRCSFKDRSDDGSDKEMVVRWPGYEGPISLTEAIDMPGVTDPTQLWKALRRRQLELILRPDTYTAEQDLDSLESARGDLVVVSHDVIDVAHASGRVRRVEGALVELTEPVTMESGRDYAIRFRRADTTTFVRRIATISGATTLVELTEEGLAPAVGDAFMFGTLGHESREVIVNRIERADDFAGTLYLIPHAPEIDSILDATVVPPWDGRVGAPVPPDTTPPLAPDFEVASGEAVSDDTGTLRVVITLRRSAGTGVELASFNVYHRLVGAGSWTSTSTDISSSIVVLTGYASGDEIEIEAEAVSRAGVTGARSAPRTHVVGATDPEVPGITAFDAVALASGQRRFSWTIAPHDDDGTYASLITARIRYGIGSVGSWAALAPLHTGVLASSPWNSWDPDEAGAYTFGIVAVDSDGRESTPVLIERTFSALPVPVAPTMNAPAVVGADVQLTGRTPNDTAVAAARFWRAAAGADFEDAVDISGPLYFGANADVPFVDLAPASGSYDYWMTVENTAGSPSDPAGPESATVP